MNLLVRLDKKLDKNRSAKSSEVQINVGMYKGNEYGKR